MKVIALVATFLSTLIITAFMMTGQPASLSMGQENLREVPAVYDSDSDTLTPTITPTIDTATFSFASIGDSQAESANFTLTVNQIATLLPNFVIFNGDLENNGFFTSEMDPMIADLKNVNLFNNTFLVRGNHDDNVSGSAALWESYFETAPNIKTLPTGVTNYVSLDSNSDNLDYSFNYGNSIFIGLDVPGNVALLTSTLLNFLDARLTYAENLGLTHAFIFFHGPLYCVESTHCTCSTKADASCTPSALVSVINKHPIVSATFHGHEHILGWTHMDNTRVAGLTGSFEQFLTSPSGGWTYNAYIYPARMDYYYPDMASSRGFASITVSGDSFTFSIYKTGTTLPVWSHTFSKAYPTPTPTGTLPTSTPTPTSTATSTPTPTATPTSPNTVTIFGRNSNWKYYAQNTDLLSIPTPYYSTLYDDSAWASGNGILGYGETYLTTTFANNDGYTYYFRKTFNLSLDPATITSLTLAATYDDGYVVYINGQEVARQKMPAGSYTYTTAGTSHESDHVYETIDLSSQIGKLVQGNNIIAVDVHNASTGSTDIVWDSDLTYLSGQPVPTNTPTQTNTPNPSGSNLVVYPYLGNTTTSSVAVSWATDNSGAGEVHYSLDQSYGNVVAATSAFYDGRDWYSATITSLAANTTYYYKVFNNGFDMTPWSTVTFTTAPGASATSYNFEVVGDNQPADASATPFPAALAIAAQMSQQDPNLVLHTGDIIYDGFACTGSTSAWSQYVRNYFDVYQAMLGKIPFFTAIGNHEVQTGGCGYPAYLSVYNLPGNAPSGSTEEFYSFDWGNAHIVSLDINQYVGQAEGYPEYNWLVTDLQTTTKPWKFVILHVPAYSSGSSGSDPEVQKWLVPLFETYGVNVVFNGHDHGYERTCPILSGACTSVENGGVVYFTNGGGGAPTSLPSGSWFTAFKANTNEFLDVTMNDCQLQLNAIDQSGIVFDTYTINRCGTPSPTFSPTPTLTRTNTPTETATDTFTPTLTNTPTATATWTFTPTLTNTPTQTETETFTPTATNTPTATATDTFTPTVTNTPTATATTTFTPTVTNTLTATATNTFSPTATSTQDEYTLTIDKVGSGTVTKAPDQATYHSGDVVILTAIPDAGWSFSVWSGACTGSGACSVTMDANKSVTAIFTQNVHSISLYPGWNLVSFNLHPLNTAIASVLSSITGSYDLVYVWDATGAHSSSGNWMKYDPTGPPYQNSLHNLDETMGFWIHMTAPATLNVYGNLPVTTNILLDDNAGGWNLVGYPSATNLNLPGALSDHGVGTAFSLIYAYHTNDTSDPWKLFDRLGAPYANDLTQMAPGWGYWVKVSTDNPWSIDY